MRTNLILDTDSYKTSHYLQYPPGMTKMHSYLESRGGVYDRTVFFGLQYLLREYMSKPIELADILEAEDFCQRHGVPFPRKMWDKVLKDHAGIIPLEICAVAEGSVVPTNNVLLTTTSSTDDPELSSLVSWFETMLMRLWYPTTVATQSWHCKRTILQHLIRSADAPWAEIDFKLHDFGSRGVSSRESAGIGGMSHLVNFKGSDTIEGIRFANHYYGCDMAAFSIPAAEHSTITSWGRDKEHEAYANMVKQFCKPGSLVACVSDSYDLYNVVENIWAGSLREQIEQSGGTLVIRPDSGDPVEVNLTVLNLLKQKVKMETNSKGFLVLPKYLRVIQGDGVNQKSIDAILTAMEQHGYSASNMAFGMGGALLQQVNRDTQKFAYKCSAVEVESKWRDVFKDPVTDHGKRSKSGRLDLIKNERGDYQTIQFTPVTEHLSELELVYHNGEVFTDSFEDIRTRANSVLYQEVK